MTVDEDLLKRCPESVDWDYISKYCELSDIFIMNHKNEINWVLLYLYQGYSDVLCKMILGAAHVNTTPHSKHNYLTFKRFAHAVLRLLKRR